MKDRSPKHPGRVKLTPVAGQTNIYDMTRADEPDDTGTPFNTRTMLQNSTAQFLKLPVSNPFVDDALRHMPDRIEPIGTVKTSPALSLGDAWLKCDGSQVAFSEYPQLCQLLRNTAGNVEWESTTIGTVPSFKSMSRAVKFKGQWYIAGGYRRKPDNSIQQMYTFTIARADSISGPYEIIYTKTMNGYATGAYSGEVIAASPVQLAASEERITAIMWDALTGVVDGNSESSTFFIVTSSDAETWTSNKCKYPSALPSGVSYNFPKQGEFATDGTYWAFPLGQYVVYTADPTSNAWQLSGKIHNTTTGQPATLRVINGTWFLTVRDGLFTATIPGAGWTERKGATSEYGYATNAVFFSDQYWFFASVNENSSARKRYLIHSTDLSSWILDDVTAANVSGDYSNSGLLATDRLLLLACSGQSAAPAERVYTTSDPNVGWSTVTLPDGAVAKNPSADVDTVLISGESVMSYHDYSTETRLLPTISLSDDTTTFIKAKNELDVFEAGGD